MCTTPPAHPPAEKLLERINIFFRNSLIYYGSNLSMNKSLNYFLYAGLFISLLSVAHTASADMTLTPGEVQLSVAGILLDVEGSASALDEISFSGSSFDITLNSGQSVTFSSADRRAFSFSGTADNYATLSCTASKSSVAFNGAGLGGPLVITITPESSTCTSESSDGGGRIFGPGEGGGFANYNFGPTPDILVPPPTPILPPTPVIPPVKPIVIKPTVPPVKIPAPPAVIPEPPYEPAPPVYVPPPVEPAPSEALPTESPATATPTESGLGFVAFLLLYWPWILVALSTVTLIGILLFFALRE